MTDEPYPEGFEEQLEAAKKELWSERGIMLDLKEQLEVARDRIEELESWAARVARYAQSLEEQYEVVPADEPDMDEWQGIGPGPTANDPKVDAYGAPIPRKPAPVVRDGVRDTRRR